MRPSRMNRLVRRLSWHGLGFGRKSRPSHLLQLLDRQSVREFAVSVLIAVSVFILRLVRIVVSPTPSFRIMPSCVVIWGFCPVEVRARVLVGTASAGWLGVGGRWNLSPLVGSIEEDMTLHSQTR